MPKHSLETQRRVVQAAIDEAKGVRALAKAMTSCRGDGKVVDGSHVLRWLKGKRQMTEGVAVLMEASTNGKARAADLFPFLAGVHLRPMSMAGRMERKLARRAAKDAANDRAAA